MFINRSTSVLTVYMQLSRNKKRNARRLYIKRARNRITRFFIVLKFIWDSKTVTIRSFWQENGHCSLGYRCFDLYTYVLVIFRIIYGANVARKNLRAFFNFICRKAIEMLGLQFCGLTALVILTANLLKHLHILKIEGVIALLSLYCNNCYMVHPRRTHRKKDLYALCAFYIT